MVPYKCSTVWVPLATGTLSRPPIWPQLSELWRVRTRKWITVPTYKVRTPFVSPLRWWLWAWAWAVSRTSATLSNGLSTNFMRTSDWPLPHAPRLKKWSLCSTRCRSESKSYSRKPHTKRSRPPLAISNTSNWSWDTYVRRRKSDRPSARLWRIEFLHRMLFNLTVPFSQKMMKKTPTVW